MKKYKHLQGWVDDPREVEAVMNQLPFPVFSDVWNPIKDSGKGKIVLLYDIVRKVSGSFPNRFQKIGDCVSMGAAYAVDCIKAVDIYLNKEFEEWVAETATEDIYWGSRNVIGNGRLGNSDGSFGAWAAKYLTDYGALPRQKYGEIDLSEYDGNRAKLWGRAGYKLPQSFIDKAKQHPVLIASQVRSYNEVRDLIANGYAVTIASNQGFSSKRDSEGFAKPWGSWAHQMCIVGMDDEYRRPGACVQNCFSDDTEVLTNQGWKYFQDLDKTEKVATVNLDSWSLEYQKPIAYQKYDYNGTMHHYKSLNQDVLVTPNHNMVSWSKWNREQKNEKFDIVKSKDTKKSNYFIRYAKNYSEGNDFESINICGHDIEINTWLEFLGFFLSEGWSTVRTRERKRKSGLLYLETDGYVGISQNEGDTLSYIEEVCSKMPFKYSKKLLHNSKNHYQIVFYNTEFAKYMSQFGKAHEKYIPDYVFAMTREKQKIIFKTLMLGDGHKTGNKYSTNSVQLRDDFQRLCINLGYTSDWYIIREKDSVYRGVCANHNIYMVSIQKKFNKPGNGCVTTIGKPKNIDYNGFVYCVTVPNHTVIVRRNGKMAITGQSWGVWNSGPKRHNQPDGSFWVDADELENRILRSGDCWAFSGYEGFKPQKLNTRIF